MIIRNAKLNYHKIMISHKLAYRNKNNTNIAVTSDDLNDFLHLYLNKHLYIITSIHTV